MITQIAIFHNSSWGKFLFSKSLGLSGINQIDVSNFDLTSEDTILKQLHLKLDKRQFRIFIDAIDYDADMSIKNPEMSYKWNALFPKVLSQYASSRDIRSIRLSSFSVFSGNDGIVPYIESTDPIPLSVYEKYLLEGENESLDGNNNSMVIRLPWIYSTSYKNSFVYKVIEAMFSHEEIYVFNDQIGNLCNLFDLQKLLQSVIDSLVDGKVNLPLTDNSKDRIYHLSSSGFSSKHEIAQEIHGIFSKLFRPMLKTREIIPISSEEDKYGLFSKNHLNCCLDSGKFTYTFKRKMPDWHFSLYNATQKIIKSIGGIGV